MKIDFDRKLKTLNGGAIRMEASEEMTLRFACIEALLQGTEEDARLPGNAYKMYALAQKLNPGGVIDLDASDVDTLKKRVEITWSRYPLIVGTTWDMLEGRDDAANSVDNDA